MKLLKLRMRLRKLMNKSARRSSSDNNMNQFLVKAVIGLLGARVCLIGLKGVCFWLALRCVESEIQLAIWVLAVLMNLI